MSPIDYDDPEIQVGGDWVKWEKVGDSVTGTISNYSKKKRTKTDGSDVTNPIFTITKDDGDDVSLEVGQVFLKQLFVEKRPQLGDRIRVTYVRDTRLPGKPSPMKEFTLEISAPAAPVVNVDAIVQTSQLDQAKAVLEAAGVVPATSGERPF